MIKLTAIAAVVAVAVAASAGAHMTEACLTLLFELDGLRDRPPPETEAEKRPRMEQFVTLLVDAKDACIWIDASEGGGLPDGYELPPLGLEPPDPAD